MGSGKRAVFLDRDGVLNQTEILDGKPYAPRDIASFELLPETIPAIRVLHKAGLILVVVTNQPDVGNGTISKMTVEAMHELLYKMLPIDLIKVCYHSQKDDCMCRKPRSGMLLEASRELDINLKKSFMVGDRWSDIVAGRSQGCYTIFIDRGYSESLKELPDTTVASLSEAADIILTRLKNC
jgi:D-glycero-D-manno-heptose 1,7-bisphosphate phosphatase